MGDLMDFGEVIADLFGRDGKGAREVVGCFRNSHERTISCKI